MATIKVTTDQGVKEFRALAVRLRRAANGAELRRELNTRIQSVGQRALQSARDSALGVEVTSSGGGGASSGLRTRVAAATEIAILPSGVRIRVVASRVDPEYGRTLARSLNNTSGRAWVHPLFGNQEAQFTQQGEEYFAPSIRRHADEFRREVRRAMHDVAGRIVG